MAGIVVIDADVGNLRSVENAFNRVGINTQRSRDPSQIASAQAIILPGVGAFGRAMNNLQEFGLVENLKAHAAAGKPLLGICLGMQLLAGESEEFGIYRGLGIIPGRVQRLKPGIVGERVPNIGWNEVEPTKKGILFPDGQVSFYYHVHSYHIVCEDKSDVAAVINYGGQKVTVSVERNNIYGVQFHPEKSQNAGLDLIERFGRHIQQSCVS